MADQRPAPGIRFEAETTIYGPVAGGDITIYQQPPPPPRFEGAPWTVPFAHDPCFVGRDADLAALATALAPEGAVVAVTGTGGLGKTALAAEYAHYHRNAYPGGCFWLNMADAAGIAAQVAGLAGPDVLQLAGWDPAASDANRALVQRAWQEPVARLLIFDNCEDPDLLRQWRPTTGGCRVLIEQPARGLDRSQRRGGPPARRLAARGGADAAARRPGARRGRPGRRAAGRCGQGRGGGRHLRHPGRPRPRRGPRGRLPRSEPRPQPARLRGPPGGRARDRRLAQRRARRGPADRPRPQRRRDLRPELRPARSGRYPATPWRARCWAGRRPARRSPSPAACCCAPPASTRTPRTPRRRPRPPCAGWRRWA